MTLNKKVITDTRKIRIGRGLQELSKWNLDLIDRLNKTALEEKGVCPHKENCNYPEYAFSITQDAREYYEKEICRSMFFICRIYELKKISEENA